MIETREPSSENSGDSNEPPRKLQRRKWETPRVITSELRSSEAKSITANETSVGTPGALGVS